MNQPIAASAINKSRPNIKFAAGDQLLFFSTLRQRIDAYFAENKISPNANTTMVVKTIVLLSAYVLPFVALLLFTPSFLVVLLAFVIMGFAKAGVGMSVMHDANHGAYSNNETINRWMSYSLNLLGGMTMNWKYQHNTLHHTYTNISGMDEDIDAKTILRFSPHVEHKQIHRHQWYYAFFFYSILTLYWAVAKDFVQYKHYMAVGLNKNKPGANRRWLVKATIIKVLYFFVWLGLPLIAGIPLLHLLTGFLVMHAISGLVLSIVFQMAHTVEETEFPMPDKDGNLENSWAVHQLQTTMNFSRGNKLLSWYVGGLNFQVEHHLFTRICHVHYPAIAPIVKQTAQEFGIPYLEKKTFMEAFVSHIRLLKKFGSPKLDEIGG